MTVEQKRIQRIRRLARTCGLRLRKGRYGILQVIHDHYNALLYESYSLDDIEAFFV